MNKANDLVVNIFISIGKVFTNLVYIRHYIYSRIHNRVCSHAFREKPEIFYPNQNGLPTIHSIDIKIRRDTHARGAIQPIECIGIYNLVVLA